MIPLSYAMVVLRQERFELRALVIAAVVTIIAIGAAGAVAASLDIRTCIAMPDLDDRCRTAIDTFNVVGGAGMTIQYATTGALAFLALVLGVQLVAKEIEHRTALLAWTLAPSRRRWYADRALVVAVVVLAITGPVGLAFDVFQSVADPLAPLGGSLNMYQARGWIVPAVSLASFGAGALWGAITGRGLPGLILGLMVGSLLIGGVFVTNRNIGIDGLAVIEDGDAGALVIDYMLVDNQTGRITTYDDAWLIMPSDDPAFETRFTPVRAGVPGDRSLSFIATHVLELAAIALGSLISAGVVVTRRRPA